MRLSLTNRATLLTFFRCFSLVSSLSARVLSIRDSAVTGRAQRASARNQPQQVSALDPPVPSDPVPTVAAPAIYADSDSTMVVDSSPAPSRSASAQIGLEPVTSTTNGRPKRKDKGKAKETDPLSIRVKEEPPMVSFNTPEPSSAHPVSTQHCNSCIFDYIRSL